MHRAYPPSAHPGDSGGFPDEMKSEILTAVNQRVVQSASDTGIRGQDLRFGMAVYDSVVYVVIVCSVWCVGAADACAESVGAGATYVAMGALVIVRARARLGGGGRVSDARR